MEVKILRLPADSYEQNRVADLDKSLEKAGLSDQARHVFFNTGRSFREEAASILGDGTVVVNTGVLPTRFERHLVCHERVEHKVKHNGSGATKGRLKRIADEFGTLLPGHHVLGVHKEYRTAQQAGMLEDLHHWHLERLEPLTTEYAPMCEVSLRNKIFGLLKR